MIKKNLDVTFMHLTHLIMIGENQIRRMATF